MKTLLIYLLQVIVTSGILYGYYHFALRNKRFHRYNRYYLLAATILSITVPFLNIPVYFAQSVTESSFVLETLTVISSAGTNNSIVLTHPETHSNWFTWENISQLFYILVALIVLLRIIFSVLKIRRIIQNNPVEQLDKIHFVNTDEPGTPFSFFRWLFWNKKIELQSEKGEQIFRHELFHIEQKHSWDTIYMELLTVVFWINPFFYLIRKEVKAIHEFLADQFAVSENTKWQYAELLLMQALNTNQHLVNPFFHNQIKRRIAMITTSKKTSHQYLRKMMVLPVAAIVIGLFAFSYKERQADKINQPSEMLQVFSDTIKPIATDNKIFDKVEIDPSFPGGNAAWKNFLAKNLNVSVPGKNKAPDGVYTVVVQFIVDKEGAISDAKALTNHRYGMEEEAVRVIKAGPNWTPAVQNGHIVKAFRKQPVTFIVGGNNKTSQTNSSQLIEVRVVAYREDKGNYTNLPKIDMAPSFVGDEAEWRKYLERNVSALLSVYKGAPVGIYTTVTQFLVKADGSTSEFKSLTNHGYGMEEEVLRVIQNSKQWEPEIVNGEKVNAYKKQLVTFEIIKSDNNFPSNVTTTGNDFNKVIVTYISQKKGDDTIIDKPDINKLKASLLIVDGKVLGKVGDNMQNPYLRNFVRTNFLDEKAATKKYGEPGKNGAMEIYTLKSKPEDYKNDIVTPGVGFAERIFDKVEVPPHFPGGDSAWRRYLMKNCKASTPVDSGAPAGTYKVYVQFQVRVDGFLEDIRTTTNYGYGMENEAMRLIKAGPPWIPAKQNGRNVRAYVLQPVTFQVEEEANTLSTKSQKAKTGTNSYKTPEITLTQLKNSTSTKLMHLPGGTEIARFQVEIDDKKGGILRSMDYGNKFSLKTKSLFDLLKVNDLIMISDIKTILGGVEKKNPAQIYRIIN